MEILMEQRNLNVYENVWKDCIYALLVEGNFYNNYPKANLDIDREYSDHGFFAEKVSRT